MKELPNFQISKSDESIDFREQFEKYLSYWPYFLASIVLSLIIALLYLRYSEPKYNATATILVKDERKGGLASELSNFADLGLMSGVKSNVDNEIEIIKSRSIMFSAIKELNFNVSYYTEGRLKTKQIYENKPIDVSFYETNEAFYKENKSYIITPNDNNTYDFSTADGKLINTFKYGSTIALLNCKMVVTKRLLTKSQGFKNTPITIEFKNIENVVQSYKNKLLVAPLNKNSSVVELSINDPVANKAEDLLNKIIEIYNEDAIKDKRYISKNTQEFINDRLVYITKELGNVENEGEKFMSSNRLTNVASDAELFIQNSVEFEKSLIETETQISVVNSMIDFLNNSPKEDVIPTNILPSFDSSNNAYMVDLINQYNGLIVERNRILKSGTQKNSTVINLNNKIDEMRKSIRESLYRFVASLKIKKSDLQKQSNLINGKITEIPRQSRELNEIARQQKIKESLYLYLVQKREEVGISLAVTAPNAKLIDAAKAKNNPVSPNRNIVFLISLFIGFIVPFLIIFISDLLDTKVKSKQDIDERISVPFLGDIPKSESDDEIINASSRSSSAEAIRIVRTNLEFMLNNVKEGRAKTIFITSTLPKEGKTFVAINLASTIALSGKKVLLIGLDIRNPKIDKYIDIPSKGLTNYLTKHNEDINDYIVKLKNFDSFYVLPSGVIPPNPADLLLNSKIEEMFDSLKNEYDYIIVDTAPVSLVTDTLLVAKHADAFIYIVRANYLDKRLLKISENFYNEGKLPNMALLLNDSVWRKSYGYGYGYAYTYGYGYEEEKSWFDKLWKKK
jgi:tyrosine-protein kinase Etk/Wzc